MVDVNCKPFSGLGFVSGSSALIEKFSVYPGKGLIEYNSNMHILISNLSRINHKNVSLPKGCVIGKVEIIDEDSIDLVTVLRENENVLGLVGEMNENKGNIELIDNLVNDKLNDRELGVLKSLLYEYKNIFDPKLKNPGGAEGVTHQINIGDNKPINQNLYRTGPKEREAQNTQIKDMLESGVIRPFKSPWASPIIMVKKKDNTLRFCIDYRKLNKITKKDVYPLPRIDDSLNALGGRIIYTTLDCSSGYHQIRMNESDKEKTAYISSERLYEFNVMPFGSCNAPATFQRYMDLCLAGLKW